METRHSVQNSFFTRVQYVASNTVQILLTPVWNFTRVWRYHLYFHICPYSLVSQCTIFVVMEFHRCCTVQLVA